MLPLSNSSTSTLRSPPRFQEDDHCSTNGESSKPSDRKCQSINEQTLLNAPVSCNYWQNESNVENRYPPGSPTLPCLTVSVYQMSSPVGTSHTIDAQVLEELQWWTYQMISQHNGAALHPPPIDMTIETDASTKGWGHCAKTQRRVGGGTSAKPTTISTTCN